MNEKVIVVLGTRSDSHVERVTQRLADRGCKDVVVIDYHAGTTFSLELDRHANRALTVDGRRLPSECIVWDKTKILPGTRYYIRAGDESSRGYAAQEWRAYYALLAAFAGDNAVNSSRSRLCMIKPYQQSAAAAVGLRVPTTLVSNRKEDIAAFQTRSDHMIMKSLSGAKVSPKGEGEYVPYVVMTMRVPAEDIAAADPDSILICPHFAQEEIAKAYELRVVVAGPRIIPFRIDSQRHESTQVDWRKATALNEYSRCELDTHLEGQIHAFMKQMGLTFGSLDFVIDKEGDAWFLECNQDGVWAWLDDLVDGEITDAFADELLRRWKALDAQAMAA
ncbi:MULTISPECIES: hypothetical protein [Lysobacter]|uniref:hypothetical protein n=1 Tax=Lysobacter TaxID=68 RepID=UPI001F43F336|nr:MULTISPECIES: hypothetical protein [Lysobacter]UJB19303.1 hypothetical protein L1A79_23810 [Lysobacter capsici]UJQ26972.1 hypothetical protein L2D09_16075 [Lysobacter gummosus]